MRARRCIQIDGRTVHFVQHGMKGSIGGISYEVHLDGGYLAGRVWSVMSLGQGGVKRKIWRARVAKYDALLYPFVTREEATKALLREYDTRRPDRPSYLRDCPEGCENGCPACYAADNPA